jgi:peptidoglycan/xylan/chitin deacetylase (PgdA/CDA1 family)
MLPVKSLGNIIVLWQRNPYSFPIMQAMQSYLMALQGWFAWRLGTPTLNKSLLTLRFDDATKGQYEYALPLLEKYGLHGVLAVPTAAIGKKTVVHDSNSRYTPIESWNQVSEFLRAHWEIASHSRNHRSKGNIWLNGPWACLSENELLDEILGSKNDLETNLGFMPKSIVVPGLTLTQNPLGKREIALAKKHYQILSLSLYDLDMFFNIPEKYADGLWGIQINPSPILRQKIRRIMRDLSTHRGYWAILFFHDIEGDGSKGSLRQKDLEMIIREIDMQHNIEVVTFTEGLRFVEA